MARLGHNLTHPLPQYQGSSLPFNLKLPICSNIPPYFFAYNPSIGPSIQKQNIRLRKEAVLCSFHQNFAAALSAPPPIGKMDRNWIHLYLIRSSFYFRRALALPQHLKSGGLLRQNCHSVLQVSPDEQSKVSPSILQPATSLPWILQQTCSKHLIHLV